MRNLHKYTGIEDYMDAKRTLSIPHVSKIDSQSGFIIKYDNDCKNMYLTFNALEDSTFSVSIPTNVSSTVTSISYSVDDGETWTECVPSESVYTTPTVQAGSKVLWKGTATALGYVNAGGVGDNSTTFSSSGNFNVSGNIMSLLYGDDFDDKMTLNRQYTFVCLFKNATHLVNATNLVLPATTLIKYCYYHMFNGCTSLTSAPKLPATKLIETCYANMFNGCTSLTSAPKLPATTLADNCYVNMFRGCTSLTTAPELPATTLKNYCYYHMFEGCTSLTTAPELPATTLADNCYSLMFSGCTSLTTAPELPAITLAKDCYSRMFYGCTSLTVAPELPATTLADNCYSGMFYGCTSMTSAPELPATTLGNYCYSQMFKGCISLTEAPELPAATLVRSCYSSMFEGCNNLNSITMLATDISASNCLNYWVGNVASTGTFTRAAAMTTLPSGNNGIPNGWTVVAV